MRHLPLLALPAVAFASTTATVTPGTWDLYTGTSKTSSHASQDACVLAARAKSVTRSYTCRTSSGVAVVYVVDPLPPVDPPVPPVTPPVGPIVGNCGLTLGGAVVFCDRFDTPAGSNSRAGDLDAAVWGVSRVSQQVNLGQGLANQWNPSTMVKCDGTTAKVQAPRDVIICNGQLRNSLNDNLTGNYEGGDVRMLAMYPKQPFDFAGRTGVVSFDVSNDSGGSHAAWPEFWITDLPIPVPFFHYAGVGTTTGGGPLPQHGFGIRFDSSAEAGQYGSCPNANNLNKRRFTIGSVVVSRNWVLEDTFIGIGRTALTVTPTDCVIASGALTSLNHIEIKVAQNTLEVWASDAGQSALRKIGTVSNANLTLTRGLVWIEDAHYNADKGPHEIPTQRDHVFAWDNVAFDGPFVYRDFSFDALDNTTPGPNGSVQLGKISDGGQFSSWDVLNLPANRQASVVRVLFSFNNEYAGIPSTLSVKVNGNLHTVPYPYTDGIQNTWRTFAIVVPITDLVTGTNKVEIGSTSRQVTANVNVVLVNVPNGKPVLPGTNNGYPN